MGLVWWTIPSPIQMKQLPETTLDAGDEIEITYLDICAYEIYPYYPRFN